MTQHSRSPARLSRTSLAAKARESIRFIDPGQALHDRIPAELRTFGAPRRG
jgi:hypothetical protein